MSITDQKLDEIIQRLARIEKALDIVPDKEITIANFEASLRSYELFAREYLKLEQTTVNNHRSAIFDFLNHSKGEINKETVKNYLESNESDSWKSNQLKALRRYIRDFLKLGKWIEEFNFAKTRAKVKQIPSDEDLIQFYGFLSDQVKVVFLVLLCSGLRIGEVLKLRVNDIDFESNMINASEIHKGDTKSSWISFITQQTSDLLDAWIDLEVDFHEENPKIFSLSARSVQQEFKNVSDMLAIPITPHLLRTVFSEKCAQAKIPDKYIDAFCGRIPQGVLARNYTDYSPQSLRKRYDIVEPLLTLPLE